MLILGGIITSYSRSGFLAVAVICIINIFIFKRFKPFVILGVIGVVAILLIPTFRLTFASYSERILDLLTGAIDTSSNIRIMLGIASINMFIDSYGLGVGFDAFSERFTSYYSIQETVGVVEPHNLTYTVLAELGMQGFIIFILIVFFLFKDALLNIRNAETIFDRILSVSFFCSFCGYILFYQFYGGGLTDNILMFNIALILTHKKFLHKSDSGLR
jgi:O-antigen ligase